MQVRTRKHFSVLAIAVGLLLIGALSIGQFDCFADDATGEKTEQRVGAVELSDDKTEQTDSRYKLEITVSPQLNIQFGDSYSADNLSDKKATIGDIEVTGSWQLSDESLTEIGQYDITVTFKANQIQYGQVEKQIKLNILPGAAKKLLTGQPSYDLIDSLGKTLADANLSIGTIEPAAGELAFDLPLDTAVEANTTYSWTFTPADDGYAPLSGEIVLFEVVVPEPQVESSPATGEPQAESDASVTGEPQAESDTSATGEPQVESDDSATDELQVDSELAEYRDYFDVSAGMWYYDAVKYAVQNKVMQGVSDEMFLPDDPTTRAMLLTILHRLSGSPQPNRNDYFSDVFRDTWYNDPINWGAEQGIANGVGDNMFMPNAELTREQLVGALYRYAVLNDYDVNGAADLDGYRDVADLAEWAEPAMRWAVDSGIISGTDEATLAPRAGATRAQMATILQRFMTKYVQ